MREFRGIQILNEIVERLKKLEVSRYEEVGKR